MAAPGSLEEVREALCEVVGEEAKFRLINTRVILRTGANLAEIPPSKNRDSKLVVKVLAALSSMGFELSNTRE